MRYAARDRVNIFGMRRMACGLRVEIGSIIDMKYIKSAHTKLWVSALTWVMLIAFHDVLSAQNGVYHIGPRDVLSLTIFAGGEVQQEVDLTVSNQGIINVPFIGPVNAAGLTPDQLEKLIEDPLAKDFFINPQVNILIKEYHSLQFYISGAIKKPGLYEMSSETTLIELIAKAGGVLPERGNVAFIQRDAGPKKSSTESVAPPVREPIKVDLKTLLDKGDMTQNLVLHSGDVVYIPLEKALNLAESKIYVEGEVKMPGVYDFQPGLTALNACIMAGGFTQFAAPGRTKVIRTDGDKQKVIRIDLDDVKKGTTKDIGLRPGDRIHVPETWL